MSERPKTVLALDRMAIETGQLIPIRSQNPVSDWSSSKSSPYWLPVAWYLRPPVFIQSIYVLFPAFLSTYATVLTFVTVFLFLFDRVYSNN